MALLTTNVATSPGITPVAPAQITAWSGTGDTISAGDIGDTGVTAIVANASGGSLDFRVEDPGFTGAGNAAANGYTMVTVPNSQSRHVKITRNNLNSTNGTVKVGASTSNAAFTVQIVK
jgi:predicted RNA-binding protein with TRAM domain